MDFLWEAAQVARRAKIRSLGELLGAAETGRAQVYNALSEGRARLVLKERERKRIEEKVRKRKIVKIKERVKERE